MNKRKLRSDTSFGITWAERQTLLKGLGKTDRDLEKPQIAIINSWSDINHGHMHLRELALQVEKGVLDAGGTPYNFNTIGLCDGLAFVGAEYILPSRDLIVNEVEVLIESYKMDAMVLLATCDKIVPAYLMAAARLNIPAIVVTGGYMGSGKLNGKRVNFVDVGRAVGGVLAGKGDREECMKIIERACPTPGACPMMGTANTMCIMAEVLGMSMPGNATVYATGREIFDIAYSAGRQIFDLWDKNITARQVLTGSAIRNAISVCMAIGGSTNSLIHLPAIATEAELPLDCMEVFDEASHKIPLLVGIVPNGEHLMEDFEQAGGVGALANTLSGELELDSLSVTGKTLKENYNGMKVLDGAVIHSLDNPISAEGALAILKGNIAPDGSVVKQSAVPQNLMTFKGPAKVFRSSDEATAALKDGKIQAGDAILITLHGAKGGPGVVTTFTFTSALAGHPLRHSVCLITDGRFSGATEGACIGYVSPESALFGPLLAVRDGDIIEYDIPKRTLNVRLSDAEIAERLKKTVLEIDYRKGYLGVYQRTVGSLLKGAVLSGRQPS
jgi:dihydroxy-acid dehydratase